MKQQKELIPMTTGEYLAKQRRERKLSLAKVATDVGLDEKLLAEIEQEGAQHIAPVYRRGYIRTYARYLQIPEEEIEGLLATTSDEAPAVHNVFSIPPKRNLLDKWLRATSYVLASLLVGTLAWQFTHEAVRLSQDGSRLSDTHESRADDSAIPSLRDQEVGRSVNASIAPLGALHETGSEGLDTAEQAWAAVTRSALPEGDSGILLSVSADSWVEITDADGQQLEMDLLRGGSDMSYHGKPPFRILLGRASAVRLSVDGEPVDLRAFGANGVAQLTWPQQLQAGNQGQDEN